MKKSFLKREEESAPFLKIFQCSPATHHSQNRMPTSCNDLIPCTILAVTPQSLHTNVDFLSVPHTSQSQPHLRTFAFAFSFARNAFSPDLPLDYSLTYSHFYPSASLSEKGSLTKPKKVLSTIIYVPLFLIHLPDIFFYIALITT